MLRGTGRVLVRRRATGLYRDNGKETGNYYLGLGLRVYHPPIMENQMEKKTENEMETGIIG